MANIQYLGSTLAGQGFDDAVISIATATLTLTVRDHAGPGRMLVFNRAAGSVCTLPAAIGSGARFRFFIGTTVTTPSDIIKVANTTDSMVGNQFVNQDGGATVTGFEAAANDDTVTLNGTTTGGIRGDTVEVVDMASGLFNVFVLSSGTGTEATCFSATV